MTVALLFTAVAAGGVDGAASGAAGAAAPGTCKLGPPVTINGISDWISAAPFKANSSTALVIFKAVYATLVTTDRKVSSRILPYLASSWKVNKTNTGITFKIRKGMTFSDGEPVTPAAVAGSLSMEVDPATKAPNVTRWAGPGPYKVSYNTEKNTVAFSVAQPYADLLYGFTQFWAGIVAPAGVAAFKQNPTSLETTSYGAGPYVYTDMVHNDHATLTRRPDFNWGPPGLPLTGCPSKVTFNIVPDLQTAENLLTTGALDATPIGYSDVDRVRKAGFHVQGTHATGVSSIIFNVNSNKSGQQFDKALRDGLMTAIDRNQYSKVNWFGLSPVYNAAGNSNVQCYTAKTDPPKYSLSNAAQILKAGGYQLSNSKLLNRDGSQVSFTLTTEDTNSGGSQYVAQQWQQLGVNVKINLLPSATFSSVQAAGNWEAIISRDVSQDPIMAPHYDRFHGTPVPTGSNWLGLVDPQVESLYVQAQAATTDEGRCAAWSTIEKYYVENRYILPLGSPTYIWAYKNYALSVAGNQISTIWNYWK